MATDDEQTAFTPAELSDSVSSVAPNSTPALSTSWPSPQPSPVDAGEGAKAIASTATPTHEPAPLPAAPATLQAGHVVDGFRLEQHLRQGSMAVLWKVSRVDANEDPTPLLMKVPRLKNGDGPVSIVGFEVEQMILPRLSGLHVPRFISKGEVAGRPYVVMERIAGESLQALAETSPLPMAEVVNIGVRVATALHALHRQHVVHLDVKPGNILFRDNGDAVLIDFGVARHDHLPDLLGEEFDTPIGTSPYMSPEQVQYVRNDPRSDVFSLGALLYQLITGEYAFGEPDSVRGLRERLYNDPVPPRKLREDCPPWLQEIVLCALEPVAIRRQASAAQLAFELQHPDQLELTERATRKSARRASKALKRWFTPSGGISPTERTNATTQLARSPIVLAAIDIADGERELLETLRLCAQRQMQCETGARLACVAVMKTHRLAMDEPNGVDGGNRHVTMLAQLKAWARPLMQALELDTEARATRVSFHVLEAADAADAVLNYAHKNHVDHIVMGARGSGALREHLGSVSSQVAARAECSVTIVRMPR